SPVPTHKSSPQTVDNLTLACQGHNQLWGEYDQIRNVIDFECSMSALAVVDANPLLEPVHNLYQDIA
ncbi:hypothetical protein, partial [Tolypothrix sp. LEGE 11397]|uniref:hypothetical protein n=1 Tax=Tolypothrix sp. LEGE 11397 TaxID=2777971 RepID=UPI001D15C1B7